MVVKSVRKGLVVAALFFLMSAAPSEAPLSTRGDEEGGSWWSRFVSWVAPVAKSRCMIVVGGVIHEYECD
jgi:hypothetical protein